MENGTTGNKEIFDSSTIKRDDTKVAQPRAQGQLRLACKPRGAKTMLDALYQKGSLKALFPRSPADHLDAVFLNTAGGITGGDAYTYALDLEKDTALRITSQAAERVYKTRTNQSGTVNVTAKIGAGAKLHWLPQETIIFDQANLARYLTVEMSDTAEFLCVEPMVFGRQAMGETVQTAKIRDQWRIRRNGELVFADALKLSGPVAEILSNPATANGASAMAAILLVSPRADTKLAPLRHAIGASGGASLIREGVLFARLLAPDSFVLRQTLIPAIEALTDSKIPKTWRL